MGILVGVILALVSVAVVALPFLWRRPGQESLESDDLTELSRQREAVYQEIRTLRQEYELREMAPEEYRARLRALRLRAATILREEERRAHSLGDLDRLLEEQIRVAREGVLGRGDGYAACPNCSAQVLPPAQECPHCGTPIPGEA